MVAIFQRNSTFIPRTGAKVSTTSLSLRAYLFTFTMSTGKKITYVGHLVFFNFKMLTFLVKQIGITLRQTLTYPTALSLTTDQNST